MKFRPVGIYRRIDGIEHLDPKERSFWQAVYAVTARGIEPGVEVKRLHGPSLDVHCINMGCLPVSTSFESSDEQ